jgi:WD40 repeat protein
MSSDGIQRFQVTPAPGARVDDYEILEEVGSGGMGTVYRAYEHPLRRVVALKALHHDVTTDPSAAKRFRREAILAASLNHPNIVRVLRIDGNEPPRYFTMDFVHGRSLREKIEAEGRHLTPEQAVAIALQVCEAIGHAHKHNIIHRDIKPGNILLQGQAEWVLVADFGIAQDTLGRLADGTENGEGAPGTIAFMSPEQVLGMKLDCRTDIFSLGMTLYYMLAGRVAYAAKNRGQLAIAFKEQLPVLPSAVNPEVSPALDAIVLRMIAVDPEKRYRDCAAVAKALKGYMEGRRGAGDKTSAAPGKAFACRACGLSNDEDARYCVRCGAGLFEQCPKCGQATRLGGRYCAKCGTDVEQKKKLQEHLRMAADHEKARRWSLAVGEANAALAIDPGDELARQVANRGEESLAEVHRLRSEAVLCCQKESYERAGDAYQEILEIAPDDTEARVALASMPRLALERDVRDARKRASSAWDQGAFEEACKEYKAMLKACPEDSEAQARLAEAPQRIQRREAARHVAAAEAAMLGRDHEKAQAEARAAIACAPDDQRAKAVLEKSQQQCQHIRQGFAQGQQAFTDQRYEEAIAAWEAVAKQAPPNVAEQVRVRIRDARDLLEQVLAALTTAKAALEAGDYGTALEQARFALAVQAHNVEAERTAQSAERARAGIEARLQAANSCLDARRYQDAITECQRILGQVKAEKSAARRAALELQSLAEGVLSRIARQDAEARAFLGRGRCRRAMALWQGVLAESPGHPAATQGIEAARKGLLRRGRRRMKTAVIVVASVGAAAVLAGVILLAVSAARDNEVAVSRAERLLAEGRPVEALDQFLQAGSFGVWDRRRSGLARAFAGRSAVRARMDAEKTRQSVADCDIGIGESSTLAEANAAELAAQEAFARGQYADAQKSWMCAISLYEILAKRMLATVQGTKEMAYAVRQQAEALNAWEDAPFAWAEAEQYAGQGQVAFDARRYGDARLFWDLALSCYQEALQVGKTKQSALSARQGLDAACEEAQGAGAERRAPTAWREAEQLREAGQNRFAAREFIEAEKAWMEATNQYSLAASLAAQAARDAAALVRHQCELAISREQPPASWGEGEQLWKTGEKLFSEKHFREAITYWEKAEGKYKVALGLAEETAKERQKALSAQGQAQEARASAGTAREAEDNWGKAEQANRAAVNAFESGRYQEATARWDEATGEYRAILATAQALAEAESEFTRELRAVADPNVLTTHGGTIGKTLVSLLDTARATGPMQPRAAAYRQAAKLVRPAACEALLSKAQDLDRRERWREALAALGDLLRLDPDNREARKLERELEAHLVSWPFDAREARWRQEAAAARLGVPKECSLDVARNVVMEFVLIPDGNFLMGSPKEEADRGDDELQHTCSIRKPFYVGVCEVTQEQYEAVQGVDPSAGKSAGRPVERVSWEEATEFCDKVLVRTSRRVRLPTEAEWEYACRSGSASAYQWGEDPKGGRGCCNAADQQVQRLKESVPARRAFDWDDGYAVTSPVRKFKPNDFGLFDMHGNVSEWCSDWYGPYLPGAATTQSGLEKGRTRVARGGSYGDGPDRMRSACRFPMQGPRSEFVGFRVVMDLGKAESAEIEAKKTELAAGHVDKAQKILVSGTGRDAYASALKEVDLALGFASADPNATWLRRSVTECLLDYRLSMQTKVHSDRVMTASFCPDGGRFITTAWTDKTILVWDAPQAPGRAVSKLEGHPGWVNCARYSADGKNIVSGCCDKVVAIWDAEACKLLSSRTGSATVCAVAFSPDGKRCVSGDTDGSVRIWNTRKEEAPQVLRGHTGWVVALAYSRDGRFIASGSCDKTVRIWNAVSGDNVAVLTGHSGDVHSVAFAPDGKVLYSASHDKTVRAWDVVRKETIRKIEDSDGIMCMVVSEPGRRIITGSGAQLFLIPEVKSAKIWDAVTGKQLAVLDACGKVTAVAISPDGTRVVAGCHDGHVQLWLATNSRVVATQPASQTAPGL